MKRGWALAIVGSVALTACGPGGEQGAGAPNGDILSNAIVPTPAPAPASPAPTRAWLGRWNGPEGTFLDVAAPAPGGTALRLTLKDDLDGPGKPYEGKVDGQTIAFLRNGEALTIRHGSGAETGFKWLADKKDCLILVHGKEGYCRD